MTPTEQATRGTLLLPLARSAIARELGLASTGTADTSADWLHAPGACFITLTQDGALRGCIGSLEAHRPLLADVQANAVAAACHDPRFAPLAVREFGHTDVEVSLLSPMQALAFHSEDEALAQLKRKAGLPAGFWHDEVRLQRYTVAKWKEGGQRLADAT